MTILSFIPIIGKILDKGLDIVDKFVEDKDKANELKAAIKEKILIQEHDYVTKQLESQTNIILAEAKGSWLQKNWRPLLMMIVILILANNYIIAPYILLFFPGKAMTLALPDVFMSLLGIGVSGYIGGRTLEKIKGKQGDMPSVKEMFND